MCRIDAQCIHAQMIESLAIGDRTHVKLVAKPMCENLFPVVRCKPDIEHPVASELIDRAGPGPAIGAVTDFRQKTCLISHGARSVRHNANYTTHYTEFIGAHLIEALEAVA